MAKSRFLILLIFFFLCVSLVLAAQNRGGSDVKSDRAPSSGAVVPGTVQDKAVGDELARVDAGVTTGDIQLLGVQYVNGHYWVTGGGSGSGGDNQLYELDIDGTVLNQMSQGTSSNWGWRDLAYDGTYLYGSDSSNINQIDMTTGYT